MLVIARNSHRNLPGIMSSAHRVVSRDWVSDSVSAPGVRISVRFGVRDKV